jgi:hypothetical protein
LGKLDRHVVGWSPAGSSAGENLSLLDEFHLVRSVGCHYSANGGIALTATTPDRALDRDRLDLSLASETFAFTEETLHAPAHFLAQSHNDGFFHLDSHLSFPVVIARFLASVRSDRQCTQDKRRVKSYGMRRNATKLLRPEVCRSAVPAERILLPPRGLQEATIA